MKTFTKKETRMLNKALATFNDAVLESKAPNDEAVNAQVELLNAYFGIEIGGLERRADTYLAIIVDGAVFYGCYPCALHY